MPTNEIEILREQVDYLEKYLSLCIGLFTDSVVRIKDDGSIKPVYTLKDHILQLMKENSEIKGVAFAQGSEEAYLDCIDLLNDIADDTEVHLQNNDKGAPLAEAYRQIGDGIHARMRLFSQEINGNGW